MSCQSTPGFKPLYCVHGTVCILYGSIDLLGHLMPLVHFHRLFLSLGKDTGAP
ncbi:unnamed protein product [Staurois parvus]|uniref:Uncharacterized protein n=1 Tax=Staurois parvus TaxID=386267 RepID=A0ABN9FIB6_9NEOB|nr:unnamed protein product [Staurois parvus]